MTTEKLGVNEKEPAFGQKTPTTIKCDSLSLSLSLSVVQVINYFQLTVSIKVTKLFFSYRRVSVTVTDIFENLYSP